MTPVRMRTVYHCPHYLQLVSGHRHNLELNEAMVCLNPSMTREVRAVFRRNNRKLLDADDYVSPARINGWLAPRKANTP